MFNLKRRQNPNPSRHPRPKRPKNPAGWWHFQSVRHGLATGCRPFTASDLAGSVYGHCLVSGLYGSWRLRPTAKACDSPVDTNQAVPQPLGGAGAHFAFWLGRQGLTALALPVLPDGGAGHDHPTALGSRRMAIRYGFFWLVFTPWISGYVATLTNQWGNSAWDH